MPEHSTSGNWDSAPHNPLRIENTEIEGGGGGGGGVTDHGALTGLSDDDHGQYELAGVEAIDNSGTFSIVGSPRTVRLIGIGPTVNMGLAAPSDIGRNFYLSYAPNFATTEPASVFNGFNTHEIPVNWTMRLTAFALNATTRVWIPTACTPATVPDLLAQITHPETSGVTDHALLTNRNHTNAHNIASITGLQTALDNLAAQTGFGFIVLDAGDPVPGGTPAGTKILRRH